MASKRTVAFRLDEDQIAHLERISAATGLDVSRLIRDAVTGLIRHYEACGRRLVYPIDYREMIQVMGIGLDAFQPLKAAEDPPKPADYPPGGE